MEPQKTTYNQSKMGKEKLLKHSVLKHAVALSDILCVNLKKNWKQQQNTHQKIKKERKMEIRKRKF